MTDRPTTLTETDQPPPPGAPPTTGVGAAYLPPERRKNGLGAAALVIGVVSAVLVFLVIFFPIAFVLGPLAIIFGAVGMARANRNEADNKNQAVAGLVLGVLSLVAAIALGVRIGTWITDHEDDFGRFWTCITSAPTETQQNNCAEELANRLDD
jgi:hypothetical protein